jgi:gluconolactonase
MPAKFRKKGRTAWSDPNRQGAEVECFLEGPSFDREGNLWIVDIPFGRIFRISPRKEWELVVQYDGWPNGLKFHKDGRAFITCYKKGLLVLDPRTGKLEPLLETAYSEGFKGLNDLHFAANGDLYFTDQGQTGIADPTGRVFRLRANGALDRLCDNVPSPNGITLSPNQDTLAVSEYRGTNVWTFHVEADGSLTAGSRSMELRVPVGKPDSGGDGSTTDVQGRYYVTSHLGIQVFDSTGRLNSVIAKPTNKGCVSVAFAGPNHEYLYACASDKVYRRKLKANGALSFQAPR